MSEKDHVFDSVESAIEAFSQGQFVIVLDAPNRENEGDLIIAASALTPERAAFMIRYTSGYLCAPMTNARADELELLPMVPHDVSRDPNKTAYTVTVDADSAQVTTGISAHDRSLTCRLLAKDGTTAKSFRRPGHVVPLRSVDGGLRARQGHTEAAVELCRLAKMSPVGVIAELVDDADMSDIKLAEMTATGMLKRDACLAFGQRWSIKVITIDAILQYLDAHP